MGNNILKDQNWDSMKQLTIEYEMPLQYTKQNGLFVESFTMTKFTTKQMIAQCKRCEKLNIEMSFEHFKSNL